MERHKINSELKKIRDEKKELDEIETISVYQNKNGKGWEKVEIPVANK